MLKIVDIMILFYVSVVVKYVRSPHRNNAIKARKESQSLGVNEDE